MSASSTSSASSSTSSTKSCSAATSCSACTDREATHASTLSWCIRGLAMVRWGSVIFSWTSSSHLPSSTPTQCCTPVISPSMSTPARKLATFWAPPTGTAESLTRRKLSCTALQSLRCLRATASALTGSSSSRTTTSRLWPSARLSGRKHTVSTRAPTSAVLLSSTLLLHSAGCFIEKSAPRYTFSESCKAACVSLSVWPPNSAPSGS
mmetsp:Transcript_10634/g.26864  ORF Transcript_10634/g.26864 Transcript_10634/m.26864 type:complete len:208 (+) Transcript_10634:1764-2387(+)